MSRLLDAAIAVHPLTWREKYADVVRGTMLDVADDRGGRVAVSETVPLVLRGLWMRARGSVAFWGSIVIVVVQVVSAATAWGAALEGSTTSYALLLNGGLFFALTVIAVIAGLAGARATMARLATPGLRLRRLISESWPLVAVAAAGYLGAFIVLSVRFGSPWPAWPTPLVLVGQLAVVLAAIAVGELLGAVLPRVLVIFAAPAALVAVVVLIFSRSNPWVPSLWSLYDGIAYETDPVPFIGISLACGIVVVLSLLAVALRPIWLRALPVVVLSAAVALVAIAEQPAYTETTYVPRSESDLVCSAVEPVICLWPEQDADFGQALRADMAAVYATGVELGLPVDDPAPRSVARLALTGISVQEGLTVDDVMNDFGRGMVGVGPDNLVNMYAFAIVAGNVDASGAGASQRTELVYAIATLLGGSVDDNRDLGAYPDWGIQLMEPSDLPDEAESRALIARWLSDGVDGVRPPS